MRGIYPAGCTRVLCEARSFYAVWREKAMFVFGIPLTFFLPLVMHVWAGLTAVITGIVAFRAPKRRGRHPRWGVRYLWAYTLVFLTATMLSFQHWETSAYLFFIALLGDGLALRGYPPREV